MMDTELVDVIAPRLGAGGAVVRDYQLLVETVDIDTQKTIQYLGDLPLKYRFWMRRVMGAKMVATSKLLTSRPGRVTHVWQTPWPFSLSEMQAALDEESRRSPWVSEMFGYIAHVSYDLLMPTMYDPGRCWVTPGADTCSCGPGRKQGAATTFAPGNYRIMDVIDVKPGRLDDLARAKETHFVPEAREFGIHLIASGTRVAEPRRLVQVWSVPNVDSLVDAIKKFSELGWYNQMFQHDIESEDQDLMVPSLHDPEPTLLSASGRTLHGDCWQFPV
jgi:hypothetical protein